MIRRASLAVLALASIAFTTVGLAQDDTCPLAGDSICQDAPYGMPPLCPMLTDASDCRTAQIAYGSSEWPLDPNFLIGRSPEWLRLARNEIFARHGRPFNSPDLNTLFRARTWYRPIAGDIVLNGVEQANVAMLARFEQDPLYPLTDQDWPTPSGSWTAMLEADGEAPRPIMGSGPFIRLDASSKNPMVSLLRTDHDLVFGWTPGQTDTAAAYGLGGLVDMPITVRTFAAYRIAIRSQGHSMLDGETVERFALQGHDEEGVPIFTGTVAVTPDGIILEADYGYLSWGCCGDDPEWLQTHYQLTGLERVPLDPSLFVPPVLDYVMAG